jgi:ATP/maltotriose-dependent transcriptional regulator MalT
MMTVAAAMAERELDPDGRDLGKMIAAGTAVQLGDASRVFDIGELLEPPPGALAILDRQVPRAIALLQLGRDEMATSLLNEVFTSARDPGLQQASGSALAFAHAVSGNADEAIAVADKVAGMEQGTYLDRINLHLARGFAFVRLGRADTARSEMADAVALADGTGDRLNQSLTRLAQARGLQAIGDEHASEALDVAEDRLAALGMEDTGWDGVYQRATGLS